uniref:Uncharacterized protein n=1 Tax=Candidatus Kentrum sp. FW TaxID=2126338 RepID=A0A450SK62_9GAMM|nr:MAG: hypothetical protein BECKFW1821B_GA0114236_101620 [Candidatus Kentron sp. FW]
MNTWHWHAAKPRTSSNESPDDFGGHANIHSLDQLPLAISTAFLGLVPMRNKGVYTALAIPERLRQLLRIGMQGSVTGSRILVLVKPVWVPLLRIGTGRSPGSTNTMTLLYNPTLFPSEEKVPGQR